MFISNFLAISAANFNVDKGFGFIVSLNSLFSFLYNLFYYLGWAIVVVGVVYTFAYIAQKLMFSEEKETFEIFSGGLTKIVLLIVLGLFLVSAGFIVKVVADTFGFNSNDIQLVVPKELF